MQKKILTGDRPTGKLHLGHYIGSLQNRIQLQSSYDQYIMIADVQALTDHFMHPQKTTQNIVELAKDYLSIGKVMKEILYNGSAKARQLAQTTMEMVREAMGITCH